MRPGIVAVLAVIASAALNSAQSAQAPSNPQYRWCVMYGAHTGDGERHCYFRRLSECRKAITGADGVCVPNEIRSDVSETRGSAGQ